MEHNDGYVSITISGSMRFYAAMLKLAEEYTREGFIVLMPFAVKGTDGQAVQANEKLDRLHNAKIDRSSRVTVVTNKQRYFGESTLKEIEYAARRGKWIKYVYAEDYA